MKKSLDGKRMQTYVILGIAVLMLLVLSVNLNQYVKQKYESGPKEERERVLSYLVQCYASEGFYPPDLEYLEKHYSLELKREDFIYFYDAFSSNIMPDLIVNSQFKEKEIQVQ